MFPRASEGRRDKWAGRRVWRWAVRGTSGQGWPWGPCGGVRLPRRVDLHEEGGIPRVPGFRGELLHELVAKSPALRVGRVGRDFGDLRVIRRGVQAALQRLQGVGLPLMGHHE